MLKKKAPQSIPSAQVFPTDVFNLIQDFFYYFFVRQIINGKLVTAFSPLFFLEHPGKCQRSESLPGKVFCKIHYRNDNRRLPRATHKENREKHIPRTHKAQRQPSSPLLWNCLRRPAQRPSGARPPLGKAVRADGPRGSAQPPLLPARQPALPARPPFSPSSARAGRAPRPGGEATRRRTHPPAGG